MPDKKEETIPLKRDACSCCPPENEKVVNHPPILLQTEVPAASCCNCCEFSEERPSCECGDIQPLTGKVKEYRVTGMDCPVCAQTLEKSLGKLPGVTSVRVNYSTSKMQVSAEETVTEESIVRHVQKLGFTAAPLEQTRNKAKAESQATVPPKFKVSPSLLSGIFLLLGYLFSKQPVIPGFVSISFYIASLLSGGLKPAKSAYYGLKSKSLDMNVLMTTAAIGAAVIGQWLEAATVVWLFSLGTALQTKTIDKTRDSIRSLMSLTPPEVWLKTGQDLSRVAVEDVSLGDIIVVKPGERIPLDGEIIAGSTSVNQAPITGESIPVDKNPGDPVFAGTVNENGSIEVKVSKLIEDTTIAKIIHLVEEAQEKKAQTQAIVDRFAKIYTPIVFILAMLTIAVAPTFGFGTWHDWFYKGLELLVIACPCALVISTPVAIVSAIGNAARNGILIKGGTSLEAAGSIQSIAFDKTGTLTTGKPKVSRIISANSSEQEILSLARTIEEYSQHPIALAILDYAKAHGIPSLPAAAAKAIVGKGAEATIGETAYYAGKPTLFTEMGLTISPDLQNLIETAQDEGHTAIVVGSRTQIAGVILIADSVREVSVKALTKLKSLGVGPIVMLTGDNKGTAKRVASATGVDQYFAELLPEDKVRTVKELQNQGNRVAMVGDGINDAPALATSNIGIAMGGAGTDAAMETADIVLMADNLEKLPHAIKLSRQTLKIIKENIWFALLVKLLALILIFPGWLTLWIAVMSDTGAALIVVLNSMRLMRVKA